jgi:hypothetical protein
MLGACGADVPKSPIAQAPKSMVDFGPWAEKWKKEDESAFWG